MAKKRTKKSGWVYFGKSERKDGSTKEYVGSTTRNMKTREAEHRGEVRKGNSKTWVGKGKSYKTTGGFWSKNARKAENTVKKNRKTDYSKGKYKSKYSKKR